MISVLEGQVAIVSGGGRGIGFAIAKAVAEAGAAVAVVARSPAEIHAAASTIHHTGGRALALTADVTDAAQIQRVADRTERELGPVTLLVNNAGTPGPVGPDWEVDAVDWWRSIAVSVRGAFVCTQATLPRMLSRSKGRIINVASRTGVGPRPFLTATSVAKTALIRFAEGLAVETQGRGVSVFAIHPGAVRTNLLTSYLQAQALSNGYRRGIRRPRTTGHRQKRLALCVCVSPRAPTISCPGAFWQSRIIWTSWWHARRRSSKRNSTCYGSGHSPRGDSVWAS